MKLLFVCTGNSCRSIMAEALMKRMLNEIGRDDVEVASAGTSAVYGVEPTHETIEALKEEGINVSGYFSKPLTRELIDESDLIFAMRDTHKYRVILILPDAKDKVRLLKENGIDDPVGSGLDVYRECLKNIKECLSKIIGEFKNDK